MPVTLHSSFDSLAPYRGALNVFARGVPFRSWQWLESWWRHYGFAEDGRALKQHQLFLLAVWSDRDELLGVAPWYCRGTRGARVLRMLGDGEVCSDYLSLLCAPGNEERVARAVANWLLAAATDKHLDPAHRWDRLELTGIDADDVPIGRLLHHLERGDCPVHHAPALDTWRIALPDSWDGYLAMLSRNHRKIIRGLITKILDTGQVTWRVVTLPEEIPAAFNIFVDLHQRRRISLGEPGCFASRPFERFHREVAVRLAEQNQVAIMLLEHAGQPLAVEYLFLGDGVSYMYQSGLDPARLDLEPGRLANIVAIRAGIDNGLQAFDFMRGNEPYKANFRATPRAALNVRVVPPRATARLRHAAWLAGQNAKQWVKSALVGLKLRESQALG